jgi:hypothetical protein
MVINTKRKATALFQGVPYNFLINGLIWKTKSTEKVFDFSWGGEQVPAITPEGFGFITRDLTIKTKRDNATTPLLISDTRNRIKQLDLEVHWEGPLGKIIKNLVLEGAEKKQGGVNVAKISTTKREVRYIKE